MRSILRVAGYLLLSGASFEALGQLSHEIYRVASLLGLGLFLSTYLPDTIGMARPSRSQGVVGGLLLVAAVPAAFWSPLGPIYLHLFVLGAVCVLFSNAKKKTQQEIRSYALALSLLVLVAEINRLFPLVWHLKQALAGELSAFAGRLAGEARNLGPTAMGLPILGALVALALVRSTMRPSLSHPRFWVSLLVLGTGHVAYLVLLTPYARWITSEHSRWVWFVLNSQVVFFLGGTVLFVLLEGATSWISTRRGGQATVPEAGSSHAALDPLWKRSLRDAGLAGGFALGILLIVLMGRSIAPDPAPVDVLVYDAGFMNWRVPEHDNYGERSGGMFGLFPGFLQAAGFRVERGRDLKRLDDANPPDCLVLINIQEYFEPADKERIWRFVRAGGGLLCLGDHTGVAGIRGPFNDLLAPTGIRFLFDSATFFASGWTNALELRQHPLNRGVRNEEDYQIWVGASLEIEPQAEPVVVAKYGYSDIGNMANWDGSYLGDRRYNPSELLGDVVLVAEEQFGNGKILVFGDTSGFQNLSLPRSYASVLRAFHHLGQPTGGQPGVAPQVVLLIVVATSLGFWTRGGTRWLPVVAVVTGLFVTGAAVSIFTSPPEVPILDWGSVEPTSLAEATGDLGPGQLALVDRSHGGRFDMRAWYDFSVGGLTLNLMRSGYFPLFVEEFPYRELEKASLLVMIAPTKPYSYRERQALRRFLERGGRLVVCAGYEEFDGSRSLLQEYGIGLRSVPLAHFRTGDSQDEDLVFMEAWPLVCPPEARVLVRQWQHPVVAGLPVGKGEIVVIADTYFLLNRNLESREAFFLGNIRFFDAVIRGERVEPVEGRFEKPGRDLEPVVDAPEGDRS